MDGVLKKTKKGTRYDGAPFLDVGLDQLEANVLAVGPFGPTAEFFGHHRNTRIAYFFIDSANKQALIEQAQQTGDFPIFHMHKPIGARGTIPMFWSDRRTRGFAAAIQFSPINVHTLIITHIAVKPGWEGRGVARRLVDAIVMDYPEAALYAHDLTHEGRAFFERYRAPDGRAVLEWTGSIFR